MAILPCSQATHSDTASSSSLPGIDALLAAIMFWSVFTPMSVASAAFMSPSKNAPPLERNCCMKSNWLPGLPALRK